MPLLREFDVLPLHDGRQSPAAMRVRRGVCRLLRELGFAAVPEVTLPSGRRADVMALGTDGAIWIVEIKSSLADFRADGKWPGYRTSCDRFYFASSPEVGDIFPQHEGLILSDGFDAHIMREAPLDRLSAPARRALTFRLAQTAARRLHELEDPAPALTVAV